MRRQPQSERPQVLSLPGSLPQPTLKPSSAAKTAAERPPHLPQPNFRPTAQRLGRPGGHHTILPAFPYPQFSQFQGFRPILPSFHTPFNQFSYIFSHILGIEAPKHPFHTLSHSLTPKSITTAFCSTDKCRHSHHHLPLIIPPTSNKNPAAFSCRGIFTSQSLIFLFLPIYNRKILFQPILRFFRCCKLLHCKQSHNQQHQTDRKYDNRILHESCNHIGHEGNCCNQNRIRQLSGYMVNMITLSTCRCHDCGIGNR